MKLNFRAAFILSKSREMGFFLEAAATRAGAGVAGGAAPPLEDAPEEPLGLPFGRSTVILTPEPSTLKSKSLKNLMYLACLGKRCTSSVSSKPGSSLTNCTALARVSWPVSRSLALRSSAYSLRACFCWVLRAALGKSSHHVPYCPLPAPA